MARNFQDRNKVLIAQAIKAKEEALKAKVAKRIKTTISNMWEDILEAASQKNSDLRRVLKDLIKARESLTKNEFSYLDAIKIVKQIRNQIANKVLDINLLPKIVEMKTQKINGLDVYFFTIEDKYLWRVEEFAKIELRDNRIFVFRFIKEDKNKKAA